MGEWYIRREYNIGGVMPRAEVCERGADPFHIICEALPEVARRIVADHEDAARLREMSEGMTACVKALDENQAWFSRSRIALTLRDALRAWADKAEALSAAPPPAGAAQEAPATEHATHHVTYSLTLDRNYCMTCDVPLDPSTAADGPDAGE